MQAKAESGGRTVTGLSQNLQAYAGASREFDQVRDQQWQRALAQLNPDQRQIVEKWPRSGGNK